MIFQKSDFWIKKIANYFFGRKKINFFWNLWKIFQFFILLTFGENLKVFEEKNWFWGQISDLWKIFGFGDNFEFWETFWIWDEISNFQNINFLEKKLGFLKKIWNSFLKCLVFRNDSDFQMFFGGASNFFGQIVGTPLEICEKIS